MVLYASNSGRVVCAEHIGGYAQAHLSRFPGARQFTTPLDHWTRMTDDDVADWLDITDGIGCEGCQEAKR